MASYTSLADIDTSAIAAAYGLATPQLEPLHGGAANSSFRLLSAEGEFVLTVLDNHDYRSAQELAMRTRAFFESGIPTTEVIPATDGALVSRIGDSPVIVKRWIPGEVIDPLPSHLLPDVGRALAKLHELPQHTVELPKGTRRLTRTQQEMIAGFADRSFANWLSQRFQHVLDHDSHISSSMVISHGDLFADNIIVRPTGDLVILDWETVSLDSALLDLGMAILGTAQESGHIPAERANLVLMGYDEVRPLSQNDLASVPLCVEHAALIIAFHRYYRHNVRFPDPDKSHMHEEIVALVEALPEPDAYGLAIANG